MMLGTIIWDFPNHIPILGFELRFYSLMFIISFILGQYGMQYVFKRENINPKLMDSLVYWMVGATIVGARLGHVFFYDWDYYSVHLSEIPKVWKGGLASHGAAIAIVLAMFYWSKKMAKKHPLWTLDRIVIVVALAAGFIRMGNWFNSEIYGAPANSLFETVYVEPARQSLLRNFGGSLESIEFKDTEKPRVTDSLTYPVLEAVLTFRKGLSEGEILSYTQNMLPTFIKGRPVDDRTIWIDQNFPTQVFTDHNGTHVQTMVLGVPRYPTQIFEALGYWAIFLLLAWMYLKKEAGEFRGRLFGIFLVGVFGYRFFIEYYKEIQVNFEDGMALNMGQWLSIPLVMAGIFFIINSAKNKNVV